MLTCTNTRKQGEIGVAAAISWLVCQGYVVCIPLADNQRFDLVVEKNGALHTVQVKTTRFKQNQYFSVLLKTCGGNKSNSSVKKFSSQEVDYLFVLTEKGEGYWIPTDQVKATNTLSLGPRMEPFKVFSDKQTLTAG